MNYNYDDIIDFIHKNSDKIIIFVGISINVFKFASFGYCIDIDPGTNFLQVNRRTLDDIIKNQNELRSLLDNNEYPDKIFEIALKKYKIRIPFITPPPIIYDNINWQLKLFKKHGYKIINSNDIYLDIVNKLSPNYT